MHLIFQFMLLGAVPLPIDIPRLKELGVRGVITLNESYETLVPSTLYYAHGIDHLVLPTRDYCFAPSLCDTYAVLWTSYMFYYWVQSHSPKMFLCFWFSSGALTLSFFSYWWSCG